MKLELEKNIQYLDRIRDQVDKTLKDYNPRKNLKRVMEDNLSKVSNDKAYFNVSFVDLDPKDKPFLMCVYPDIQELDKRCKPLVELLNEGSPSEFVELWNTIPMWNIEIDTRLLNKKSPLCIDNGSQFVAMLCHELGHVANAQPMLLAHNYKMKTAEFNMYEKVFLKKGFSILRLFLPMFVCISGLRILVRKPTMIADEIGADMRVPDKYKQYLIDYTENHILTNPETAHGIIITEEEYNAEQSKGVEFTKDCIFLMKKRRSALKVYLTTQYKLSPSKYFRDICLYVNKGVSGLNLDTDKVDLFKDHRVMESFNRDSERFLKESIALIESAHVTERDIVILSTQAESIATPDDKRYVLNTIYDYLEALEKKREKDLKKFKDINKIPPEVLNDPKIKMLQDMKMKVIDTKVSYDADHYGVFIKYPKGYEG